MICFNSVFKSSWLSKRRTLYPCACAVSRIPFNIKGERPITELDITGIVSSHFSSSLLLYEQLCKLHYCVPSDLSLVSLKENDQNAISYFLCQTAAHFLEIDGVGGESRTVVQATDGNALMCEALDMCRAAGADRLLNYFENCFPMQLAQFQSFSD